MKRFRWDFFYIFAALLITLFTAIAYLCAITLPARAKTLITAEIENATGKSTLIRSMRFEILKGLVLDGLVLYDNASVIIRAKEATSGFLIPPVFRKKVIIPKILIKSPFILVERRADNSFNVPELIPRDYVSKSGVPVAIYSIVIRDGVINFTDKTLSPPFVKRIENADIDIRLALPDRITLNIDCIIPSDAPAKIKASGEYKIPKKESSARITVKNFSPKEFVDYYRTAGLSFPGGLLDAGMDLRIKEGIIDAGVNASTKKLVVSRDNVRATLDSNVKAILQYDAVFKHLKYAGDIYIDYMDIAGIDTVGKLENIKAKVEFNNSRVSSDNITANAFGIPWKARINLVNFDNPVFDIYAASETHLSVLRKILADNFNIKLPTDIAGKSNIDLAVQIEPGNPPKLNGYIQMSDAVISLGSSNFPIEHINGEAQFTANSLTWSGLGLMYRGRTYKASGALTNFESPDVQLDVASEEISFKSIFAVDDKLIKLTRLDGRYYDSEFSAAGRLGLDGPDSVKADINGRIDLELNDLLEAFKSSPDLQKAKPAGRLELEFALKGDMKDLKRCDIAARAKSGRVSLYGMELTGLTSDYAQSEGAGYIKSSNSSFYGGSMSTTGRINWASKELPYSFILNIKGAKLEKYKKDTEMKSKDLAGDIKLYAHLSGSFKDASTLTGLGKISIAKGKLWQLDLFGGLGMLIFTSDFSDVVFAEGSCDFKIKDKVFYTNNISLKSDLLDLYGTGALGFDRSVSALLRPELAEDAMYPGFRKNIATAIGKGTLIEVSGTLKDPKYKARPSVSGIAEGMANVFLQQ
ncbi:MAG: DUF748 domain-containing protein [Candidatus Omnitrophota bacterium]